MSGRYHPVEGQKPSINLSRCTDRRDAELLCDESFMTNFLNAQLEAHNSALRIKPLEVYWHSRGPNLGPCCYLTLVSEDGTKRPMVFGCYNPGVTWRELRSGSELERARLEYARGIRSEELHAEAGELVDALTVKVGERILNYATPSAPANSPTRESLALQEESRLLGEGLPHHGL